MDALTFIQQLYDNNAIAGSVDGWAIHTYNGAIPGQYTDGLGFQQATQLPGAIVARADSAAARVWITDSGTATCGPIVDYHLSDEFAWADESEQGAWLTNQWNAFQNVTGHGLFVWHNLRDGSPYPTGYTGTRSTASPSTSWPAD